MTMVTSPYAADMASEIRASDFKATCLALLDEVAESHAEFVVTKYGRPVARLVPIEPAGSVRGSITFVTDDDDLLSTGESWEAMGGE